MNQAAAAAAAVGNLGLSVNNNNNNNNNNNGVNLSGGNGVVVNGVANGVVVNGIGVPVGDIKPPTGAFQMPLQMQDQKQQQQQHHEQQQQQQQSPQHHLIPRMGPTGTAIVKHELYFPQCYAPPFNQAFGQQQQQSQQQQSQQQQQQQPQQLVQVGAVADGSAILNVGSTPTPVSSSVVVPAPTTVQ